MREVLGHAHQGVVDRRVAVGVVLTDDVADDPGALACRAVCRLQAQLLHGVEDAAVHRLQAVADVGQGPADDDGHGVVQVGLRASRPRCWSGMRSEAIGLRFHRRSRCPGFGTFSALSSMNWRRGSTASPMRTVKMSSAPRRVLDADLQEACGSRGSWSSPRAARVHLAEPLVALDREPLLPLGEEVLDQLAARVAIVVSPPSTTGGRLVQSTISVVGGRGPGTRRT